MAHHGDTDRSTYQVRGVDKPLGKKKRVKKQSPPATAQVIAPGAELPRPRQKKPHEREAEHPESYFTHEESVPMFDFEGGRGGTMRHGVRKQINLQREAEIVERIHDVAVLAEPKDAARLLPRALDLGSTLKTRYALNEVRGYIAMLAQKAQAVEAKVEKRRVYLKPGENAPPGHATREGKRGGRYYEVGDKGDRHEPKPKMAHLGQMDAAAFDLADGCVDIAREMGWFAQVDAIRAFSPEEWADKFKGRETGPGGKPSTAAPYASYNYGEIALGPKGQQDLWFAAQGSRTHGAKYGVQAMAHEIVHSRNPIRNFDYFAEHALIEEALAEWLCPDLATKILTDRLGWSDWEARCAPESYWDEVRTLEVVAGAIVGSKFPDREEIRDEVMHWKNMSPPERSHRIRRKLVGVLAREDFPDLSDEDVEKIADSNTQFTNWNALWYSTGDMSRMQTMKGMQHSCYQAAKAMLAERGELPDWAKEGEKKVGRAKKTAEDIKAAARERVKRWRQRLKEEGREEVRGGKRPEGWVKAIRDKKGLGLVDVAPDVLRDVRKVLPNCQEVVSIGGKQYPLLARRTARGLSWFISDAKGKRISETVYGGDGAAAFIEILKRESQRLEKDDLAFGVPAGAQVGVDKDFAGPPADAMVGEDVHVPAIGSAERRRARRKKRREGIFDATGNQYTQKQEAAGGVSSEDMGPRKVLEVPDTAKCDKGACEIFDATYGSEILTRAVPQEANPNSRPVSVLYKADNEEEREIVVGGYASPQVIDRERHLISREAMKEDLPRFLAHPKYRNVMLLHSNVQVGEVLPEWTDPETGKTFRTEVDDVGLFCVIRVRTDRFKPPIVDQVIEDIEDGKLAAFSISGDAPLESRQYTCNDGKCFWYISEIVFYEITLCEEGVNQDARLVILSKSLDERRHTCPVCAGKITKADTTLIDIAEGKIHASYTEAMDRLRELGHLDREERIALSDAITAALEAFGKKVNALGLADRKVPADDAAIIAKFIERAPERVRLVERIMEGVSGMTDADLSLLVNDHWPEQSEMESESAEALREKVEAVAEGAGEREAIRMLEHVQEAEEKAGSPGYAGPTTTGSMQDFGSSVISRQRPRRDKCMECDKPPTKEVKWAEGMAIAWFCDECFEKWKAEVGEDEIVWVHPVKDGVVEKGVPVASPWMDDLILDEVIRYKDFLEAGAEPEEAYDKIIEEAGNDKPWFGTRQDEMGYWLLHVDQDGLPIPNVRLRVDPRESGEERAPDPHWTAPSLLEVWKQSLTEYGEALGKRGALPYEGIIAPKKPEIEEVREVQGEGAVLRAVTHKGRVYLPEGKEAPEGVDVQEGPRGGRYYEDPGRRGDAPEAARERARRYHQKLREQRQQAATRLKRLSPGEWVHMTDAASAQKIEEQGVQFKRGGRGGFYVARVGSTVWGDVPVRIKVRGSIVRQGTPEWDKLAAEAHKRGGSESDYNQVAREMGYDAIHLPGRGTSNWLAVVNPEAAIIQREEADEPEKAHTDDPWKSYPNAPQTPEVTEKRRKKLFDSLKKQGRLNDDGTVSMWHVTTPDRVDSIMKQGFIPAKEEAPGQYWQAEHSPYATYFHCDRFAAMSNAMQMNEMAEMDEPAASVVEARIPLDGGGLRRIIPDEDVSLDTNEGLDALERGESVAVIGGWPAGWLQSISNEQAESWYKEEMARWEGKALEPRDALEDIDEVHHPKNVNVKVGMPSYVAQAQGAATPATPIKAPSVTGGEGKPQSPEASEDPVQTRAEGTGGLGVPQPGGRMRKARRYLGEGEEAPEGVEVHEGPKGGRYYEEGGKKRESGGLAAVSRQVPADYEDKRIQQAQKAAQKAQKDVYLVPTMRGLDMTFNKPPSWQNYHKVAPSGEVETHTYDPGAEAGEVAAKATEPLDTITTTPLTVGSRTPREGVVTPPDKDYTAKTETNEGVPGTHDESDTRGAPVTLAEIARAHRLLREGTTWLDKQRHDADSDQPTAIAKRGKRRWPSPLELVNREVRRTKKRMAGHCEDLWKDEIDLADWEHMMQKEIDDLYGRSASSAIRRTKDVEGAQQRARDDLLLEMRDQRRYLANFRNDLATKGITKKRLIQRARMYADGAAGLYHSIVAGALPSRKAYWRLAKGAKHCDDCVEMAKKSPFPSNNMPRLPRDGSTMCMANCRCYLTYGPVPKMKVVERRKG